MMKFSAFLFFSFFYLSTSAQWEMLLCANADKIETCKPTGSSFKWSGDRVNLQLLLINKEGLKSEKLRFIIFYMKAENEGDLYADLSLTIPDTEALFAVKKVYFAKKGTFKIDVLDAATNEPVATGKVIITD